jgi:hypothetical protein
MCVGSQLGFLPRLYTCISCYVILSSKKQGKDTSIRCRPDFRKSIALLDGSQASPACPSDKFGIKMKMSMKQWWNNIDRDKPTYWERNLSQCHFAHDTSDISWPGIEPCLVATDGHLTEQDSSFEAVPGMSLSKQGYALLHCTLCTCWVHTCALPKHQPTIRPSYNCRLQMCDVEQAARI